MENQEISSNPQREIQKREDLLAPAIPQKYWPLAASWAQVGFTGLGLSPCDPPSPVPGAARLSLAHWEASVDDESVCGVPTERRGNKSEQEEGREIREVSDHIGSSRSEREGTYQGRKYRHR